MIEIQKLKKDFEGKVVLNGISMVIPDGHIQVIVGRSGCGKTVLLRSILGLIKPDTGSIRVNGQEVVGADRRKLFEIRRQFGMLFQGAALFDSMTVSGNVGLALKEHTKLGKEEIREKVQEKLDVVGLGDIGEKKPAELSGGMKKRVGLARALIMDPKYVLYDEPTTGLDPIMSTAIDKLIRDTQQRLGITSIVVTHDMRSALRTGDRFAMISEGELIFEGNADEFQHSEHAEIRQFLDGQSIFQGRN